MPQALHLYGQANEIWTHKPDTRSNAFKPLITCRTDQPPEYFVGDGLYGLDDFAPGKISDGIYYRRIVENIFELIAPDVSA